MHALRVNPGYFGVADSESDLILNRWSTLMYASPHSLLFPASISKLAIVHYLVLFSGSGKPRIATLAFLLVLQPLCASYTTSLILSHPVDRDPAALLLNCKFQT